MKKVVLLSGGIDSTTCLAQAVQVCGAENVTALCVFYGQKHSREMAAARKVAAYYGVRLLEQDIAGAATDFVRLNELTAQKSEIEAALEQKMDRWMYLEELAEELGLK